MIRSIINILIFASALLCASETALAQTSSTWLGGSGLWADGSKWSNGVPDNSGTFDVFVDGNNPTASNVTEAFGDISQLNISIGDVLQIGNGGGSSSRLAVSDSLENHGVIITSLGGQLDNTITGYGDFFSESFEFQPNSRIAPSDNHDMSPAGTGELTLVVFSELANFAGKVELDLAAAGADPSVINQIIGELDYVRVFGEALLDGVVEVNFVDTFEPQIGDFFDIIAASRLATGSNFEFVGPAEFGYQIDIVNRPFGTSSLNIMRVTVTESSGATDIAPSSFEVTRGTLASGTVADLAASDNEDISVRRKVSDIQSVVQVVAFGNSVNAFPTAIDITVESAVFARSEVLLEIYAYDFIANSYELVDARAASRFVDRVDTVALSGDINRFITPAAGNMMIMIRFVSANNRQQFTANIDQAIWTILE